MAIYHCSTKPISRSSGRSATASIAYRAGVSIEDHRQGKTFDYTKRTGVLHAELLTPSNLEISRSELWNLAEEIETRKNSRTAREFVIHIPNELMEKSHETGIAAARNFSEELKNRYGVAVDFAVHSPDKHGDKRNYHAHILLTTRKLERLESGRIALTGKSDLEQSNTQLKQQGKLSNQDELKQIRKLWADIANNHLDQANIKERIDHRSHKDRGLEELPTVKMGWKATELERKGIKTDVGDQNRLIKQYNLNLQIKRGLEVLERTNIAKEKFEAESMASKQPHTTLEIKNDPEIPKIKKDALERKSEHPSTTSKPDLSIDDKKLLVDAYKTKIGVLAKQIFNSEIDEMTKKLSEYKEIITQSLSNIEKMKLEKPFNPFKVPAWKEQLNQAVNRYNNGIKVNYDNLLNDLKNKKNLGVNFEHYQKAESQMYQLDKSAYSKIKEFEQEIKDQSLDNKPVKDQSFDRGR